MCAYVKGEKRFRSTGNETLNPIENTTYNNPGSDGYATKTRLPLILAEKGKLAFADDLPNDGKAVSKSIKFVQKHVADVIIGDDDREEILETTYPYNVMCFLQIKTSSNHVFPGTGFFISSRCVITAGHCVFESKKWVKSITVIPGVIGDLVPYGETTSSRFRSVEGWTENLDANFDYGAVILADNTLHSKIQATLGFKLFNEEQHIEIAGYPKDKQRRPWRSEGPIQRKSQYKLFYDLDTEAGNSGSPILVSQNQSSFAIGLHTTGAKPNQGIKLRQEILDRWAEWAKL